MILKIPSIEELGKITLVNPPILNKIQTRMIGFYLNIYFLNLIRKALNKKY